MAAEPADESPPVISPEDDEYYAELARAYVGGLLGARSRASGLSSAEGYLPSSLLDYLDPRHAAVVRTLELLSAEDKVPWGGLSLRVGRHILAPALLRFGLAGELPHGVNPIVAAAGYGDYLRTARDHGLLNRDEFAALTPLSQAQLELTAATLADGCLRHRLVEAADRIERLTAPGATFDPDGVLVALRPVRSAVSEQIGLEIAHRGMHFAERTELPRDELPLRDRAAMLGRSLRELAGRGGVHSIDRYKHADREIASYLRLAERAEGRGSGRGRPRSVDAAARGFDVAPQEGSGDRSPEPEGPGPVGRGPHRVRFDRPFRRRRPRNGGQDGGDAPGVG